MSIEELAFCIARLREFREEEQSSRIQFHYLKQELNKLYFNNSMRNITRWMGNSYWWKDTDGNIHKESFTLQALKTRKAQDIRTVCLLVNKIVHCRNEIKGLTIWLNKNNITHY